MKPKKVSLLVIIRRWGYISIVIANNMTNGEIVNNKQNNVEHNRNGNKRTKESNNANEVEKRKKN